MNKVTIPSNVADAIEYFREQSEGNRTIIIRVNDRDLFHGTNTDALRSIPFDTLLSALVNGYVREKTEAERHAELVRYYRRWTDGLMDCSYDDARAETVRDVLRILGITIAGINENQTEVSANV